MLRFQISPAYCGRAIRVLRPSVPLGTKWTGNSVDEAQVSKSVSAADVCLPQCVTRTK